MKVWVLTQEYNDYDQYGEYFEAVFAEKPSADKLRPYLDGYSADHVLNGGGRRGYEYCWFNLREEDCE